MCNLLIGRTEDYISEMTRQDAQDCQTYCFCSIGFREQQVALSIKDSVFKYSGNIMTKWAQV